MAHEPSTRSGGKSREGTEHRPRNAASGRLPNAPAGRPPDAADTRPRAGPTPRPEGGRDAPPGTACANCGTSLAGAWCHACGQRARALHPPLGALLSEAADVLFDVDNRFVRSASTLMRRPGALSVAWAEGRRASFTGPVRLYLLTSVLYFLVASLVEPTSLGFITFDSGPEMNRRFAEALPRMMFAIVPLAAAVFALAFRSSGRPYVEHLIFALHVHAGWYVLFTLEAAVALLAPNGFVAGDPLAIGASLLQLALRLGTIVYLFLATRRFYGRGRASTATRTIGALLGYSALLAVAVAAYVGAAPMLES